jgi:hypothetical protein
VGGSQKEPLAVEAEIAVLKLKIAEAKPDGPFISRLILFIRIAQAQSVQIWVIDIPKVRVLQFQGSSDKGISRWNGTIEFQRL